MKSKRRHELQQNSLSEGMTRAWEWAKKNVNRILTAVLVVLIVALVVVLAQRHFRSKAMESRTQYAQAVETRNVDELMRIARAGEDKQLAAMAAAEAGDIYSVQYVSALSTAPEQADEHFKNAQEAYKLATGYGEYATVAARAHLGLGTLAESRSDWDTARNEYSAATTIAGTEDHPAALMAKQRLERLDSLQKPVTMATTAPARPQTDTAPATLPEFEIDLDAPADTDDGTAAPADETQPGDEPTAAPADTDEATAAPADETQSDDEPTAAPADIDEATAAPGDEPTAAPAATTEPVE
jgi:hypothetical protein